MAYYKIMTYIVVALTVVEIQTDLCQERGTRRLKRAFKLEQEMKHGVIQSNNRKATPSLW